MTGLARKSLDAQVRVVQQSYLRIIAVSLGLAFALSFLAWVFGPGPRYQLMTVAGQEFVLQVANTPELQERGLRGQSSLAPDAGLLVLLDKPKALLYSTRRTPFSIDVLYFTADGTVQKIDTILAQDDNLASSTSGAPVHGALQLLGGTAARLRIQVGSNLPVIPPRRQQRDRDNPDWDGE